MKKTLTLILVILSLTLIITGCGKKEDNNTKNDNTVAANLVLEFEKEMPKSKNIKEVADKLIKTNIITPHVEYLEMKEGDYLAGFKEEIKGYKSAVIIAPTISTIPFIAYIFEVDNPNEFANNLKEQANLRWNICTEADEMKVSVVDNYVFFVMSPNNFDN